MENLHKLNEYTEKEYTELEHLTVEIELVVEASSYLLKIKDTP